MYIKSITSKLIFFVSKRVSIPNSKENLCDFFFSFDKKFFVMKDLEIQIIIKMRQNRKYQAIMNRNMTPCLVIESMSSTYRIEHINPLLCHIYFRMNMFENICDSPYFFGDNKIITF